MPHEVLLQTNYKVSHPLNTRLLLIRAGMQTDNLAFQQQCQPLLPPIPPCYGWFLLLQAPVVPVQLSQMVSRTAPLTFSPSHSKRLCYPGVISSSHPSYVTHPTQTHERTEQWRKGVRAIQVGSTTIPPKKNSPHKTMASHTHCHHEFNKQWLEPALKPQWILQVTLV